MSQLVRLEGKHTWQNAHCALQRPEPICNPSSCSGVYTKHWRLGLFSQLLIKSKDKYCLFFVLLLSPSKNLINSNLAQGDRSANCAHLQCHHSCGKYRHQLTSLVLSWSKPDPFYHGREPGVKYILIAKSQLPGIIVTIICLTISEWSYYFAFDRSPTLLVKGKSVPQKRENIDVYSTVGDVQKVYIQHTLAY